ncbi:MAG: alpha/beta fold hydrolase [Neisseriaceae bacterium]|nr:alpha/beta fold hydrolase [Neisseriaceae bacterium]
MKKLKSTIYFLSCISLLIMLNACMPQERVIFTPKRLSHNHQFHFNAPFEELNIVNAQGVVLNGLHFYAQNQPKPKGAILFLHGNADNINRWGKYSDLWTKLGYDFFVFDYQGFGKSGGSIKNEKQLYDDIHLMFQHINQQFEKNQITIIGYSIGTGLAAESAQHFGLQRVILIAPYFDFHKLAKQKVPFIPSSLIRYKIPTNEFLSNMVEQNPNTQIIIFHGKKDKIIRVNHSENLSNLLKENVQFWALDCGHRDILSADSFNKIMTQYFK